MIVLVRGTRTHRVSRAVAVALALGALAYAPFYFAPFRVFQISLLFAFACALVGLNLLTGYGGQISIGHGAFFALGAYTAAILMTNVEGSGVYLLALPLAAGVAFTLGYLLGIPALRLRGIYLALATLALSVVTPPLLRRFRDLTGGGGGLRPSPPAPPEWLPLAQDQWIYVLVVGVTLLLFWWSHNVVGTRVGRALAAIRDNEVAAQTMGVDCAHYKTLAFAVASTYAAVGGVLFVWAVGFVSPESFGLLLSINMLVGLVVGGLGSPLGPFIGAAFLRFVPGLAERIDDAMPGVVFGALLVAVVLVAPNGVAGFLRGLRERIVVVRTPTVASSTPGAAHALRPPPSSDHTTTAQEASRP